MDTIFFDYGLYSYAFAEERGDSNFDFLNIQINGRLFEMVKRIDQLGLVGAYTADLPDQYRLTMVCFDCVDRDQALEIFETIKFKE